MDKVLTAECRLMDGFRGGTREHWLQTADVLVESSGSC